MDGVKRTLAKKKTPWQEDLYFTVKFARQKLWKYYADVTSMTGIHLLSPHILEPFLKLRSFRKWENGMDIYPEDKTSYYTQYQEAFLKYVENENYTEHRRWSVIKPNNVPGSNHFHSTKACGFGQSSFHQYDLSSNDEEYITPESVAETTPGRSNHTAPLSRAARLYFNSPPEEPKNWGQGNPNLNDYHFNPMEISSTFWLLALPDCWHQQEETHAKYADLSKVACNIFSIIRHGDGVEVRFSLGHDIISWRQSKATGETLPENVIVMQMARGNYTISSGDYTALDLTQTENDLDLRNVAVERNLCRMAKVHDFCKGEYRHVRPCTARDGNWEDTVAHKDLTDYMCRCVGKIIARDLRLMASQLYKTVLPGPGHVTCSCAVTSSPCLGADLLGCIIPYKSRKGKKQKESNQIMVPRTQSYEPISPTTDQYRSGWPFGRSSAWGKLHHHLTGIKKW